MLLQQRLVLSHSLSYDSMSQINVFIFQSVWEKMVWFQKDERLIKAFNIYSRIRISMVTVKIDWVTDCENGKCTYTFKYPLWCVGALLKTVLAVIYKKLSIVQDETVTCAHTDSQFIVLQVYLHEHDIGILLFKVILSPFQCIFISTCDWDLLNHLEQWY